MLESSLNKNRPAHSPGGEPQANLKEQLPQLRRKTFYEATFFSRIISKKTNIFAA